MRAGPVDNGNMSTLTDRDLVVSCLHYRGSCNRLLSERQQIAALTRCDGFGRMTLDQLEILHDWSHVRDSSPAGLADAAHYIRETIGSRRLLMVAEVVGELGITAGE